MSRGDAVRTALRGVGQTLITFGVVVLLFCVYELWFTNLVTAREQDRLGDALRRTWAEAPRTASQPGGAPERVPLGTGFAVLHLPSLGEDGDPKVVVEGVGTEDLKKGPGHIPGTAAPGQLGNTVISGHRTTYGAPFADLDRLRPGDAVVVETRDSWFTYTVRGTQIVAPSAVEVTYPVPGDADAVPTRRLLTLTTCHPRYSAKQRLVVSAELTATTAQSDGPPAALTGA